MKQAIPCTIMRGGTSKGLFFLKHDLPSDAEKTDQLLLRVMGSPDKKQIDGLGGATSVTSKVAILAPSDREDADVDYTFAQVSVDKALVSYKGNCGNISSAVGPFAIEKGLIKTTDPITKVRIYNTNTDKIIVSEVHTENGNVVYHGGFAIAGVPGTAAEIKLSFLKPSGAVTGKLLPTGNAADMIDVPGKGSVMVSIVDAANPLIFVKASDIGMSGTELPGDIDKDQKLLHLLETVRGMAAVRMGLIEDYKKSAWDTPGIPKMTIISRASDYQATDGNKIVKQDIDLISRMMSMQKAHPSYAMTGAMCTVAAAAIPGSVVNQLLRDDVDFRYFRIGHPAGILPAGICFRRMPEGKIEVDETFGFRTANLLMDGAAFY